jgi:exosortase H (IPTLxxWG-CTERM-specific)
MLRFLITFCVCALASFALLLAPPLRPAVMLFSRSLVVASASIISAGGGQVRIEGGDRTILSHPATGSGVEMKDGCNGVNVTLLLCSALIAFPVSWLPRLKGLVIGTLAIQIVNLARFISLFFLLEYNRPLFDFAHDYLWESLIMLDALVVFWIWVYGLRRSSRAVPA